MVQAEGVPEHDGDTDDDNVLIRRRWCPLRLRLGVCMFPHAPTEFSAWEGEQSRIEREDAAAMEPYTQGDSFEALKRCEGSVPGD